MWGIKIPPNAVRRQCVREQAILVLDYVLKILDHLLKILEVFCSLQS